MRSVLGEVLAQTWDTAEVPEPPGAHHWPLEQLTEQTVVLVGRSGDEHLRALADELSQRGAHPAWLRIDDPSAIPTSRIEGPVPFRTKCRAVVCRETTAATPLAHHNDRTVRLPPAWRSLPPHVRTHAALETEAAVLAWLDGLDAPLWVNDPWEAQRGALKTRQLRAASAHHLRIPDSLIGTDPAGIRAFAGDDAIVHKALREPLVWYDATAAGFLYTTRLSADHLESLEESLRYPALFQRQIAAPSELRVTVVGDRTFAVRLRFDPSLGPDWRRALPARAVRYEACSLPPDLELAIVATVRALDLWFAAVDLIEDADGPVFLEANPPAAYRWLEVGLGLPITAALADLVLAD